jgi:hypothetical protein
MEGFKSFVVDREVQQDNDNEAGDDDLSSNPFLQEDRGLAFQIQQETQQQEQQ